MNEPVWLELNIHLSPVEKITWQWRGGRCVANGTSYVDVHDAIEQAWTAYDTFWNKVAEAE